MLRKKQGGSELNMKKNHNIYQRACRGILICWQKKQKQTQEVSEWGCWIHERQMHKQTREEMRKGNPARRQEEGR